ELAVAVGHQGGLGRQGLRAERMEARVALAGRRERIALEVELDPVLAAQRGQRQYVVGADVARVRARVHGDAVGARVEAGARGTDHVRGLAAARVPQYRDLVDVDAEHGHRAQSSAPPDAPTAPATAAAPAPRAGAPTTAAPAGPGAPAAPRRTRR